MGKEKGNHPTQLKPDDIGNRLTDPTMKNDEIGQRVKAKKGSLTYAGELQAGFEPTLEFTGTVFGLVRRPHNGFANYSVVELIVENGRVVGAHYDQAMAGIESMGRVDLKNNEVLEELRKGYPSGFAMAVL